MAELTPEFEKRLLALEAALKGILALDRRAGLFGAQAIARAALQGEKVELQAPAYSLSDPKYYARARRCLERNWDNRCAYCNVSGTAERLEIEHAHPVSRGGSDAPNNPLLACHACNSRKGTKTIEEFGFGELIYKLAGQTLSD